MISGVGKDRSGVARFAVVSSRMRATSWLARRIVTTNPHLGPDRRSGHLHSLLHFKTCAKRNTE